MFSFLCNGLCLIPYWTETLKNLFHNPSSLSVHGKNIPLLGEFEVCDTLKIFNRNNETQTQLKT